MSSLNWQTLQSLEVLHRKIQDVLADLSHDRCESTVWVGSSGSTWIPEVKIRETAASIILEMQIPESQLEGLDVQISPETAVIRAKSVHDVVEGFFSPAQMQHIIPLPMPVHPEAVQANLKQSTLTLVLPKSGAVERQRITLHLANTNFVPNHQEFISAEAFR